jgi:hypothetical protein
VNTAYVHPCCMLDSEEITVEQITVTSARDETVGGGRNEGERRVGRAGRAHH